MIRSMTGFGHGEGTVGSVRAVVEARSVNHRFFTSSIKVPGSFSKWEAEIRECMRSTISRGHVTLTVRIESVPGEAAYVNETRFAAALAELRMLCERHSISGDVDVASVLRMPEVLSGAKEEVIPDSPEELLVIVSAALRELNGARQAEGGRLAAVLEQRLQLVEHAVTRIVARAPERLLAHRDKLRNAVYELTNGLSIDENRLAQEVALLADRLDVAEEADRFQSHIVAFRQTLSGNGNDGAGKRLGFLLQEMLREANTMGSKGADAEILHEVVAIKEELERIREQVENLE